jgi:hypothetical protein
VSPGSHFGATVVNDGGSAGAPSTVTSLNVSVLAIGLLSAGTGRHAEDIAEASGPV